jgi:hypothetical protein
MRHAAAAAAGVLCALVAGCGSSPGDILGLGISGGPQRQAVRMHVMEDGRASCNARPLHQLPSALVLTARNVVRDAKPLVKRGASFGAPSATQRTFELRTPDGTTTWTEAAPGLPAVLPQAEVLALELEHMLC